MDYTSGSHIWSLQTPIFTGKNYEYWSLIMNALLRGQDVWDIVQNGYTKPTDHATYNNLMEARMILRNHNYLKVYKCSRILQILKMTTIK